MRKDIKLLLILITLNAPILYFGIETKQATIKEPVYVPYFYNGQILSPAWFENDTTVVFDAIGLNKAMAVIEQGTGDPNNEFGSDEDYRDLFSEFTLPLADYSRDSALINTLTYTKY